MKRRTGPPNRQRGPQNGQANSVSDCHTNWIGLLAGRGYVWFGAGCFHGFVQQRLLENLRKIVVTPTFWNAPNGNRVVVVTAKRS